MIGAFPTVNCRTPEELDDWLADIGTGCSEHADATGAAGAGLRQPDRARSNPRLADDLPVLLRTSPKSSSPASARRRRWSARCMRPARSSSPTSPRSAMPSARVAAGADGLVLLTAGAGGQTGWLNPFAFVRAVRAFFDGPIVLAGGISDGHALCAARGARLRPRLYGHQVHRHAREHGGRRLQGDAGRELAPTT